MSIFKNMSGFLCYIIGAAIILPLLLIAYNYFFINKNDGKKYMRSYIEDSIEIKLNIPAVKTNNIKDRIDQTVKSKSLTISMETKNMGRDGIRRANMDYRLIYDPNLKKYFKIIMFDLYHTFFWEVKKNRLIYAKVNKYEMQNFKFGTQDNQ
ncbi:hypothetical protein QFZ20_005493 [Flavobacterium sp. W4I14]|nr:hypothetical protein [Flavobacterium sp. W4I14]